MSFFDVMFALMRDLLTQYPPILQIRMVSTILKQEVATTRAQIKRGSFAVRVRQEPGGRQYVLMTDLAKFLVDGEVQSQPSVRQVRLPRNPLGINGKRKRGRPKNAEREIAKRKSELHRDRHVGMTT